MYPHVELLYANKIFLDSFRSLDELLLFPTCAFLYASPFWIYFIYCYTSVRKMLIYLPKCELTTKEMIKHLIICLDIFSVGQFIMKVFFLAVLVFELRALYLLGSALPFESLCQP
jgi:hypothetical protein